MYLPALPTLEQLKAACPIGPWPGDERLRIELTSLQFASKMVNTIICHSDADNEYRALSKAVGATTHAEMILGEKGREAVSGMSPIELVELYFSQRITMTPAEDRVLQMGNPRAMMQALMGAMTGEGGGPGESTIVLVREFINQMFHLLVGLAIMRAMPGVAFAPHFVNWCIIKGETAYICSYNAVEDGLAYPVDADGNRITLEAAHAAPDNDPRVTATKELAEALDLRKGGDHDATRQRILDNPNLAYQLH